MAYIRNITLAGCILFVEKYHTYRYNRRNIPRGNNAKPTTEVQKQINARHAARNRILKACENFQPGSLFIRLSYFYGERPDGIDEAHNILRKFMKAVKRKDKDLKYMGVTELGSRGGLHHHLLVPADFDLNLVKKLWRGGIDIRQTYTGELSQLASYLTKGECDYMLENPREHKEIDKRYIASRNLKKPVQHKEIIKKSEHWTDTPRSMKFEDKIYDVKVGSEYTGVTKDGYEYQHYIMIERKTYAQKNEVIPVRRYSCYETHGKE
ncbi:MAG: hypothetical protein ACI4A5_11090 [Hominilimicola sp.]